MELKTYISQIYLYLFFLNQHVLLFDYLINKYLNF